MLKLIKQTQIFEKMFSLQDFVLKKFIILLKLNIKLNLSNYYSHITYPYINCIKIFACLFPSIAALIIHSGFVLHSVVVVGTVCVLYPLILKVNTVILTYCRITLEDDDEDEDLDVEPAPRRPVLVISDSLKEGLQRGISDILPHTVAQSVYVILILLLECLMLNELIRNMTCFTSESFLMSFFFSPRSHSCMELVLWRPPDDPFCRKRKGSLHKQRKQQTVSQQPLTPCSSPTPHSPSSPPADTHSSLYSFPVAHSSGEEDMEM